MSSSAGAPISSTHPGRPTELTDAELDELTSDLFQHDDDDEVFLEAMAKMDAEAQLALPSGGADEDSVPSPATAETADNATSHAVNEIVDSFVKTFLEQSDAVAALHSQLADCDSNLRTMERTLHDFGENIHSVKDDIGQLRERAKDVAVSLYNSKHSERMVAECLHGLVVPPEVVRMLVLSDDQEIGPQTSVAIRRLYEILVFRHKHKGWLTKSGRLATGGGSNLDDPNSDVASQSSRGGIAASTVTATSIGIRPLGSKSRSGRKTDATSSIGTGAHLPGSGIGAGDQPGLTEHEDLSGFYAYVELTRITEQLTLFTLSKIRTFLLSKFQVLRKPRTNVAIQQHNVLRGYRHLVFFMKQAPTLLGPPPGGHKCGPAPKAGASHSQQPTGPRQLQPASQAAVAGGGGSQQPDDPTAAAVDAAILAKGMYYEVKKYYTDSLAWVYRDKLQQYVVSLNKLEESGDTSKTSPSPGSGAPGAAVTAGGSSGGGGFFGKAGAFFGGSSSSPSSGASGALGAVPQGAGVKGGTIQPTLTSTSPHVTPEDFYVSQSRIQVFDTIRAPPVIPHMVQLALQAHARASNVPNRGGAGPGPPPVHTFIDTFRSVNVLLTDAVTSEFLFTFEFFGGDTTVYVDVFKESIQVIVDYVSEVLLGGDRNSVLRRGKMNSSTSSGGQSVLEAQMNKVKAERLEWLAKLKCNCGGLDYNGLLTLIRMVHYFKIEMQRMRKLYCLDSYFDSLLLLLWPRFDAAIEVQLNALREVTSAQQLLVLYSNTRFHSVLERLKYPHPLVSRISAFTASLIALSSGTVPLTASSGQMAMEDSHGSDPRGGSMTNRRKSSSNAVKTQHHNPLALLPASGSATMQRQDLPPVEGALVAMVDMDYAESTERFSVLQSKVSVLLLELERLLKASEIALGEQTVIASGSGAVGTTSAGASAKLLPVFAALSVNTLYHVLEEWKGVVAPPPVPFDLHSFDAGTGPGLSNNGDSQRDLTAMLDGTESQHSGDTHSEPNSSFATTGGGSPLRGGDGGQSQLLASLHFDPSNGSNNGETGGGGAGPAAPSIKRAIDQTTCRDDLVKLEKMLEQSRNRLTDQLLKALMPDFFLISGGGGQGPDASLSHEDLLKSAKVFVDGWRTQLELLVSSIRKYIEHPANAEAMIKVVFSRIVLAHAKANAALVASHAKQHTATTPTSPNGVAGGGQDGNVIQQVGGIDRALKPFMVSHQQVVHCMAQLYRASQQ